MSKKKKPKTIKEIINDILNNMNDETKDILANAEPDFLGEYSQFHFGLGTQIRNKYDLWAYGDADYISAKIINKLINKIKHEKHLTNIGK